ncbi:MAG: hypothetical protein ABIH65_03080 [Nanoarchaeota archaeon]
MLSEEIIKNTLACIIDKTTKDYECKAKDWHVDVYNQLNMAKKKKLIALLEKNASVPQKILTEEFTYTVHSLKEKGYDFHVYLKDNINLDSLLFIPTVSYLAEVTDLCFRDPPNKVAYKWSKGESSFSTGFDDFPSIPDEIITYFPMSFVEKEGIVMYLSKSDLKERLKENIQKFKNDLKEKFLRFDPSPLDYQIKSILKKEYLSLKKKVEEMEEQKEKRNLINLIGKRF